MNYNIHPIFVHFPIALLFVYSIVKVLPFSKWFANVSWKSVERVLLVFGVLGAFAALATGDTAEHLTHPVRQLVEAHSTFAGIATWLYGLLLVGEIALVVNSQYKKFISSEMIQKFVNFVEKILCHPFFSNVLAVLGFVSITVTGLLGGVMVYGQTADPLAGIVLKILGINL